MTIPSVVRYDVEALRSDQFPVTRDTVYLNNAAIAPIPRRTYEALNVANEHLMLNPSKGYETLFSERYIAFHETMRALINAHSAEEIVGVSSTSLGVNFSAQGLRWQVGDNLILSHGEFPSNVFPWMRLKEQYGVDVRMLPSKDGGLTVDMLESAVDAKTKLVAVSVFQFFSGHRADLQALGDFCHERGILFLVDAIQGAGHTPIDVQAMHIDILCSGGQKSLMGPTGHGFLYVRQDLVEQMQPAMLGPNAVIDAAHYLQYNLELLPGAARFATGTFSLTGMVGLLESVTLLREIGIAAIDEHVTGVADYAIERLKAAGYQVITPASHGPIVTFRAVPGDQNDEPTTALIAALKAKNIYTTKHWDANNAAYVRVSLHCFNNQMDIDRLMDALKENAK